MSILLQKGGDFMTLIKQPFKKKRSTVAGDKRRSPSMTPKSTRGSTARSSSIVSSVNSCAESDSVVECDINASTKNIYVDIDDYNKFDVATNICLSYDERPPLPVANAVSIKVIKVPQISECEHFDEFVDDLLSVAGIEKRLNCSKNNLLLIDDYMMTTATDNHLNNVELNDQNLDKLMQSQQAVEIEDQEDGIFSELKSEKNKLKTKIAKKIKILREATRNAPGSSEVSTKDSFKKRAKNIFPKFENQESSEKLRANRIFIPSFMKKSSFISDETDEDFEEIKKCPLEDKIKTTDLDGIKNLAEFSSTFIQKFKVMAIKSKKPKKSSSQICARCSNVVFDFGGRFQTKKLSNDNLCVCFDFDEFDNDGTCINNFEYKNVSVFFMIWHDACVKLLLYF